MRKPGLVHRAVGVEQFPPRVPPRATHPTYRAGGFPNPSFGGGLGGLRSGWQEADRLRAYVTAVRWTLARPDGSLDEADPAWLEWAEGYIGRLDPLTDPSAIPAKWAEEPEPEPPPQKRRWDCSYLGSS